MNWTTTTKAMAHPPRPLGWRCHARSPAARDRARSDLAKPLAIQLRCCVQRRRTRCGSGRSIRSSAMSGTTCGRWLTLPVETAQVETILFDLPCLLHEPCRPQVDPELSRPGHRVATTWRRQPSMFVAFSYPCSQSFGLPEDTRANVTTRASLKLCNHNRNRFSLSAVPQRIALGGRNVCSDPDSWSGNLHLY